MRAISIIYRRELGAYLKSPLGYIIAACALLVDGLLFYTQALGPRAAARLSGDVLRLFFEYSSGVTMTAAILLSLRLLAQERHAGTLVLLNTSPVRDIEIVLGKYLAALTFLVGLILLSVYMPLLILVNGKISFAHVTVGYIGMILIGAATLAIGMFASAMTREQLIAGVVGAVIAISFFLLHFLAQMLNPPLQQIVADLAIHHNHFWPFEQGILHLKHVVYYLAVIYFFLLLAVKTMEAKRWQ